MKKVNLSKIEQETWTSPQGVFSASFQGISLALGREATSHDLLKRHPFDVEVTTIPPGKRMCPYHAHAAQWEYYQVLSGEGIVRDEDGEHTVVAGDCFLYKPGEAHALRNGSEADFVYITVADNPIADPCYYPDSNKVAVRVKDRHILSADEPLEYFHGEE